MTQARNLKDALCGTSNQDVVEQTGEDKSNALTAFYKQQVKLERQKLQSKSTLIQNSAERNFETVPIP